MITLLAPHRRTEEDGASLLLVIVVMTLLLSLVAGMTLLAVSSLRNSVSTRNAAYYNVAVDAAISEAMAVANNPTPTRDIHDFIGESKQKISNLGGKGEHNLGVKYRWYVMPVTNVAEQIATYEGSAYRLITTGFTGDDPNNPNNSRTVETIITANSAEGAQEISGTMYYRPTRDSVFSWGLFGAESVTVQGASGISGYGTTGGTGSFTDDVRVATNGNVLSTRPINQMPYANLMASSPTYGTPERCKGALCQYPNTIEYPYGIDLSVVDDWVAAECAGKAKPSVSGDKITLNPGVNCFNDITLRGDVDIQYDGMMASSGQPAMIYVAGNLIFEPGTRFSNPVNNSAITSTNGPLPYRFYVSGQTVNIAYSGGVSRSTAVHAMIAAGNAECRVGSAGNTAPVRYFGSLACNSVTLDGASGDNTTYALWYDMSTQITTKKVPANNQFWLASNSRVITPGE